MKIITPTLYLKGTFNGWGLDTPFTENGLNCFSASVVFSVDTHKFKIADMDGREEWTFSAHPTKATALDLDDTTQLIHTQGIGNDLTFSPSQTGRYTLHLDLNSHTPTLTIVLAENGAETASNRGLESYSLAITTGELPRLSAVNHALDPQDLFDTLAIESDRPFPYVFGDNVDGYYEGRTLSFSCGDRYRHHQGWHLGGFGSYVDGQLNDKNTANKARLLPYGIEHQFESSSDILSLVQNQRLVCLTVRATTKSALSIVPELNLPLNHTQVEQHDGVLVYTLEAEYCPEGCPRFIAISANQAVTANEVSFATHPELNQVMHLANENTKLMLTSQAKTDLLTVYLSFEHDKEKAIASAKNAAIDHGFVRHQQKLYQFLTHSYLWSDDIEYNRAVMWARLASRNFVSHEFGTGIWAGLPWFKDCWGRDTFIALSGTSLANGQFDEAKAIIENFAAMQMTDKQSKNYGRIPNRVTSKTNIIYNTTDGTPWMIREIMEYINYSGDLAFAHKMYPVVARFIEGVENNYLDEDGLMKHRHPDTWMDAKINGQIPWSPRGPKANDIQALWFESLQCAILLAELIDDEESQAKWRAMADKVKESFVQKFWNENTLQLADRLNAGDTPDYSVRPNQLMTLTTPQHNALISDSIGAHIVKNSVSTLLFPWGICSLDQHHTDFHPYHDNRSEYHKDAAYHNGTIWGWNAGFTVTALAQYRQQDFAYTLSKNLAKQILEQGHRGTMSENLDAYQQDPSQLVETGTYAQAWSVSEYARNAQQDYLGFKPKLLEGVIELAPALPTQWRTATATLPYGEKSTLNVHYERVDNTQVYLLSATQAESDVKLKVRLTGSPNEQVEITCDLTLPLEVKIDNGEVSLSREVEQFNKVAKTHFPELDTLCFAQPDMRLKHRSLESKDYLLKQREAENLELAKD